MQCAVCGGESFVRRPVLWEKLISDWQLSAAEADYIDRQQGQCCGRCGSNLRSIAELPRAAVISLLEINEAGTLSPVLRKFGGYVFGAYPQVDIHHLPYPDAHFDLVVHSDTLEHVENPVHALTECRRVLKPNGALCFTVPVVVGRLTRNRRGLPPSYHGNPATAAADWAVQTEFGADTWASLFEAGFQEVTIHAFMYPAGLAFLARPAAIGTSASVPAASA